MAINKSNYSNSQEPKKTFQEKKDARRKERLARATAKADERLGITGKDPMANAPAVVNKIVDADVDAPVFVPSATEYIDATGPTQKSTIVQNLRPIVNAIASTPVPESGTEIFDEASKNKNATLSDIQSAAAAASRIGQVRKDADDQEKVAVENELDKVRAQSGTNASSPNFANSVLAAMNLVSKGQPMPPMPQMQQSETVNVGPEGVSVQEDELVGNEDVSTLDSETIAGGGGATTTSAPGGIASVVSSGGTGRPSYEATATKDDVKGDVTGPAKSTPEDFYYPEPDLEKLDVHDYYPEVGKSIAVGNWTGSVLGSQTIYTGAGTLLPMGLYDARKRALSKAAKERQAFVDKLYDLPATSEQFNKKYQDHGYKMLQDDFNKYGSYEAMAKDPAWRRKMGEFRNIGVELTYADKQADALLDSVSKGNWAPKKAREAAYRLRDGVVNNFDDIMSGKSSVLKDVNILKSYANGVDFIDEKVKGGIFKPENMSQMPLNMKTGKAGDMEKFAQEREDFLLKVKNNDPSLRDHEVYAKGVIKFFDIPMVEQMIDARIASGNYDPDTRNDLVEYAVAQIPKQVIMDYEKFANKDVERMAEANKMKRWAKEIELREKDRMTHYEMELNIMRSPGEDGKTYAQKIKEIQSNKKLNSQQKALAISKAAMDWGGRPSTRNKHTKSEVFVQTVPENMQSKPLLSKPSTSLIDVWEPMLQKVVKNGKTTYVPLKDSEGNIRYNPTSISMREFSNKKPGLFLDVNKKPIDKNHILAVKNALKADAMWMYPQQQQTYLVADNGRGGAETVTNLNLGKLNLNKTGYGISTYGKTSTVGKTSIVDGEEVFEPGLELPAGIRTEALLDNAPDRENLDKTRGASIKGKEYANYGNYNTTSTGSSSGEYY